MKEGICRVILLPVITYEHTSRIKIPLLFVLCHLIHARLHLIVVHVMFFVSFCQFHFNWLLLYVCVYFLQVACDQVGRGVLKPPELFGNFAASIKEVSASHAYGSPLVSEKVSRDSRRDLVRALTAARLEGKGRTTGEAAAAEAATTAAQAQTQANELEHLARRMAAGIKMELLHV